MRCDENTVRPGHRAVPDAMRTGEIVLVEDLAAAERWGEYRVSVLAHGVRSSLSMPLTDGTPGALNLYTTRLRAFGETEREYAQRFAAEASRALALATWMARQSELTTQLEAALTSRATIDQAIGIIMGQNRCDADRAFDLLRAASQNRNVKLRTVAAEIVAAVSETPDPGTRRGLTPAQLASTWGRAPPTRGRATAVAAGPARELHGPGRRRAPWAAPGRPAGRGCASTARSASRPCCARTGR